jgi:hypothetical protein
MGRAGTPGEAALHLVDGVALLRPDCPVSLTSRQSY